MKPWSFALSFLVLMTLPLAADAAAPSSGRGTIDLGADAGVGVVSNGGGIELQVGAQGGYKLDPNWGAGLILQYNSLGSSLNPGSGNSVSASQTMLAADGDYYFSDVLDGLRAGLRLGFAWGSTNETGASSNTNFTYGALVSYDYPLGASFTLGGEANFMIVSTTNNFNILNLFAALKYWI